MKKILFLSLTLLFVLSGCFQADKTKENSTKVNPNDKAVILYFSKPEMNGSDTVAGASRVVTENEEILGNVEQLATWIAEDTKYPLAKIKTTENYPDDHEVLVDQATTERSSDFRPELKALNVDLTEYDTIYIGYPIWWSDLPMAMYSFFEKNDLAGKTIIPFSSHGGSGLAGTVETVKELSKDASVETSNVLSISRDDIPNSRKEVENWLKSFYLRN
ncbi:hypothetical protein A5819_003672 [Enterococcus sp. 7E2_DIV0204]|uniref:flavodoxin n=1 Tax=unclassified Enterococcus TaxID=2608891 RepID=UPI000B734508|nr:MULTISPECIES: flavodoxin [unclassified Enterococcus]OTN83853.1 hypothetical protein A5819_003672 [Enterococcus sp. 7E2_DIV0204]OTP47505.1 hypothetical protein A5884_003476 [Enterococcus sp. 7D2_DIV0200]